VGASWFEIASEIEPLSFEPPRSENLTPKGALVIFGISKYYSTPGMVLLYKLLPSFFLAPLFFCLTYFFVSCLSILFLFFCFDESSMVKQNTIRSVEFFFITLFLSIDCIINTKSSSCKPT